MAWCFCVIAYINKTCGHRGERSDYVVDVRSLDAERREFIANRLCQYGATVLSFAVPTKPRSNLFVHYDALYADRQPVTLTLRLPTSLIAANDDHLFSLTVFAKIVRRNGDNILVRTGHSGTRRTLKSATNRKNKVFQVAHMTMSRLKAGFTQQINLPLTFMEDKFGVEQPTLRVLADRGKSSAYHVYVCVCLSVLLVYCG